MARPGRDFDASRLRALEDLKKGWAGRSGPPTSVDPQTCPHPERNTCNHRRRRWWQLVRSCWPDLEGASAVSLLGSAIPGVRCEGEQRGPGNTDRTHRSGRNHPSSTELWSSLRSPRLSAISKKDTPRGRSSSPCEAHRELPRVIIGSSRASAPPAIDATTTDECHRRCSAFSEHFFDAIQHGDRGNRLSAQFAERRRLVSDFPASDGQVGARHSPLQPPQSLSRDSDPLADAFNEAPPRHTP